MRTKIGALAGSLIFFCVAPGTIAGLLPYQITRWRMQPPLLGIGASRVAGAVLLAAGLALLVDCFLRFALQGRGTPAPIAPPEILVATGFYRRVRNPMYVAIITIVIGQSLLLGSVDLLLYAAAVWLMFHAFVMLYEEPRLREQFGASYDAYRVNVPRWLPRIHPWQGVAQR